MILQELLNEALLDEYAQMHVQHSMSIISEHYSIDILDPLSSILSSTESSIEKKKDIETQFKPIGGIIGLSAMISSMLLYLTVPTSEKEFVQLYLAMGCTQDKVKAHFANSQYKSSFSPENIDFVVNDWRGINQRFIKAGMKVNNIAGFTVKDKDDRSLTGYKGVKYFLENLNDFSATEINSFLGALKKIKATVDAKYKAKFKDLARDESSGLV